MTLSNGLSSFTGAPGTEIYGCLTYNNGWDAPDRGHGHGIYVQNAGDAKLINENLIFNNFDAGLHAAGSPDSTIQNILMTGNVVFNNGQAGGHRVDNIIAEGGGGPLRGILLDSNYVYNPTAPVGNGGYNRVGWQFDSVNDNVIVRNNVWVGGDPGLMLANWTNVTFTGNTLYAQTNDATNYNGQLQLRLMAGQSSAGYIWDNNTYYASGWRMFTLNQNDVSTWSYEFAAWQAMTGLDAHSHMVDSKPAGVWTYVRPNQYEPGRANIVIYNWALQPSVSVDISGIGLPSGQRYEVRDAQNFYGNPVAAGTYNGQPISIAMNGLTVVQPWGGTPSLVHTAPEFGAFVVLPVIRYTRQPASRRVGGIGKYPHHTEFGMVERLRAG